MTSTGEERNELAQFEVQREGDSVRIDLLGEVDFSNATDILERALAAGTGAREVLVDLSALGFIDSAGISVLDRLARMLSEGSTKLVIVAGPDTVAGRTLALAGMDQVLPMSATVPGGGPGAAGQPDGSPGGAGQPA